MADLDRMANSRKQDQARVLQPTFASMMAGGRLQSRFLRGNYRIDADEAAYDTLLGPAMGFAHLANTNALLHDGMAAARQIGLAQTAGFVPANVVLETRWNVAAGAGDWPAALAAAQALAQMAAQDDPPGTPVFVRLHRVRLPVYYRPWLALAEARTGDLAGSRRLAVMGPLDCYLCVRVRAQVAEAAGDHADADRWFAEAVRQAPSLPFAHLEWGEAKLARGDGAGAIAELSKAHAGSPRFADATEALGEALAASGDTRGSEAKYAEANSITPKWGRLHLKWGEALGKLGRAERARAEFRIAATLDLSGSDRAELAAQRV